MTSFMNGSFGIRLSLLKYIEQSGIYDQKMLQIKDYDKFLISILGHCMDYASSEEIHFDAVQWFPEILVKPLNERKARKIQNNKPFKCNNIKDQFEILRNSEVAIEFETDGSVSLSKFTDFFVPSPYFFHCTFSFPFTLKVISRKFTLSMGVKFKIFLGSS